MFFVCSYSEKHKQEAGWLKTDNESVKWMGFCCVGHTQHSSAVLMAVRVSAENTCVDSRALDTCTHLHHGLLLFLHVLDLRLHGLLHLPQALTLSGGCSIFWLVLRGRGQREVHFLCLTGHTRSHVHDVLHCDTLGGGVVALCSDSYLIVSIVQQAIVVTIRYCAKQTTLINYIYIKRQIMQNKSKLRVGKH